MAGADSVSTQCLFASASLLDVVLYVGECRSGCQRKLKRVMPAAFENSAPHSRPLQWTCTTTFNGSLALRRLTSDADEYHIGVPEM